MLFDLNDKPIIYTGCIDRWCRNPVFRRQMIKNNNYSIEDMAVMDRIGNESADDWQSRKKSGKMTHEQRVEATHNFNVVPADAPSLAWYDGRRPSWSLQVTNQHIAQDQRYIAQDQRYRRHGSNTR